MNPFELVLSASLGTGAGKDIQAQLTAMKDLHVDDVKVNLDIDSIQSQLNNLELNIGDITIDDSKVENKTKKLKQNVSKTGAEAGKGFSDSFNQSTKLNFDTKNMAKLESELSSYAKKLAALNGFELSKVSVDTENTGKFKSADITYYNDKLKETVVQTYKLDAANESLVDSTDQIYLSNVKSSTNTQKQSKELSDAILIRRELTEQMKSLNMEAEKSKVSLNPKNMDDFNKLSGTASTNSEIKELRSLYNLAKIEFKQLNDAVDSGLDTASVKKMNNKIKEMPINIQDIETNFRRLKSQPESLRSEIDELSVSYKKLNNISDDDQTGKIAAYNELKSKISLVNKETQSLIKVQAQQVSEFDVSKFESKIDKWVVVNPEDAKKAESQIARIKSELADVDKVTFDSLGKEFDSIASKTDTTGIRNMNNHIKEMPINIQNVGTNFKKLQVQPDSLKSKIDELSNSFKKLDNIEDQDKKIEAYKKLKSEISLVDKETQSLIKSQEMQVSQYDVSKFESKVDKWAVMNPESAKQVESQLISIKDKLVGIDKVTFNSVQKEFGSIVTQTDIAGIEDMNNSIKKMPFTLQDVDTNFKRLQEQPNSLRIKIDELINSFKELDNIEDQGKKVEAYKKLKSEISLVSKETQTLTKVQSQQVSQFEVVAFESTIKKWMNENTQGAKAYVNELTRIQEGLVGVDKVNLKSFKDEFASITKASDAAGLSGRTLFQELKHNFKKFSSWVSVSAVFYSMVRGMKAVFENVKEVDAAMINLKKVTSETDSTYDNFLVSTTQKAKELGVSISELVEASADFARLGYSLPDASKLAEVATLYKNVGDGITIGDATTSLISTMKAFNVEAEDSIGIVDRFNEVGNNFAISSAGIGDALQRSASALVGAGNTMDEAIALTVAANNVVQDPEKTGKLVPEYTVMYIWKVAISVKR